MPVYVTECQKCGKRQDIFREIDARDTDLPKHCEQVMPRIVCFRGYTVSDIQPYRSMVTGESITSRSKHRAHLKRHGLVEIGNDSSLLKPKTKSMIEGNEQFSDKRYEQDIKRAIAEVRNH